MLRDDRAPSPVAPTRRTAAAGLLVEPPRPRWRAARRRGTAWVGAVRHVGRAVLGELLAQHGHDLLAEDVELLEHGLQRQTGVVHQEQLALVVAEVLAHGQRSGR